MKRIDLNLRHLLGCALTVLMSLSCAAQATNPVTTQPVENFYAAGVSWSPGAQPAIAGTFMYSHLSIQSTSTYLFTAVDLLPTSLHPLTVVTNVGAGVAQPVFSLGNVKVYVPAAAGLSVNGPNTGWNWSGGGAATIPVGTKGLYLVPNLRFLKSNVSSGSGYQLIAGLAIGLGK